MKILSAQQIRDVDRHTIENEPIPSIDLMERAAAAFVDWFAKRISPKQRVSIICGRGNNGGDGLAIGRMLIKRRYDVALYIIEKNKNASDDFLTNKKRLEPQTPLADIKVSDDIPDFSNVDVVIDGLFGSGLSRPVEGLYAEVIDAINRSQAEVIAIDIPSGLFSDKPSYEGAIIQATHTISFQFPKLAFLFPENFQYVGNWEVVNIGLDTKYANGLASDHYYITDSLVDPLVKKRSKYDHKGTWGRALIISGSYGKIGASVLSAKAAMRSGVGLLTMYIPVCGYEVIQTTIPEAMVLLDEGDHFLTGSPDVTQYSAVGIGPGLGKEQETMMSVIQTLREASQPVVIDADGLNIIADHREMLEMLPEGSVLTPHPKEFERLVGDWSNDFERLEKQRQLAREHNVVVVLKGNHTSVASPSGKVYFNSTGNPGMATGGSGDVLTGIVTALLAQGYEPEHAAIIGVFIHGRAGDLAADKKGFISLIASDIIDNLAEAFNKL